MQRFVYSAKDEQTQKVVKSVVQADSEREAAKLLLAQGLSPLSIQEEAEGNIFTRLTQRISSKDKVTFTRSLATLIEAGLPLSQSLHTIVDQTQNPKMRQVVQDIIVSVEGGHSLGDSFAKHPQVFDRIFLALIRAGEISGTLDKALRRIADQQEKDAETMRKVRGAMYYPGIVLVVIIAVVVFMMVTIVPQVAKLYEGLGKDLPLLTAALVATSTFIVKFWWLVLILFGLGAYFFRQYLQTESGVRFADRIKLNAPVLKGMFRKLYMARFTRTGETLLSTGVPMLDMLNIAAESVNNTFVGESIHNAEEQVKGGVALSKALKDQDYITTLIPQMIKIGEQSGQIDQMLGKVAKVYEDELDEQIKALSTTIEPLLMVVMAVFAGGIVVAILFPIYNLVTVTGGNLN
ncbi:type IV pilus assembly protein PilC [Candidatus Mycosynbacter amalyticus]|uniref:Type IV pilus assembly protein PilC n=1 Tax=Candidatus Mycosynbacter amalyticus TaxID=2665156 RepID=A0A857MJV9_9BACT|nr:type II secretion system F family protein [Candidatus Mycosynbacter amalyticus]QHN42428.1 type IV pilus assembly protein PilC [Candidatus Mycosynbacter amalyticus]